MKRRESAFASNVSAQRLRSAAASISVTINSKLSEQIYYLYLDFYHGFLQMADILAAGAERERESINKSSSS